MNKTLKILIAVGGGIIILIIFFWFLNTFLLPRIFESRTKTTITQTNSISPQNKEVSVYLQENPTDDSQNNQKQPEESKATTTKSTPDTSSSQNITVTPTVTTQPSVTKKQPQPSTSKQTMPSDKGYFESQESAYKI